MKRIDPLIKVLFSALVLLAPAAATSGRLSPANDLSNVSVYPVPFRPSQGDSLITFSNLSSIATIRIFTLNGELVRELRKDDAGIQLVWDVRNSGGQSLASDVYVYVVDNGSETRTGKLVVER